MDALNSTSSRGSLGVLRQFVRRSAARPERCELCSLELAPEHPHLLEIASRRVLCSCEPCAILFSNQAVARYRRIPWRVRWLRDFVLDDQQWDSLLIPINLAFFFHDSVAGRTLAYYPSPAGATESLLDLEYWNVVVERNPVLKQMESDVEALLVNRVGSAREYFVAPIDQCYRLVGLIRTHWRGFSGGPEAWKQIQAFFDELKQRSPERGVSGAPISGALGGKVRRA